MKKMDHANYPRQLKHKPVESLRFIIRDANEAIAAHPTGENAGYYADEVLYAASELKRRKAA